MEYFSQIIHNLVNRILPSSKARTPVEVSRMDAYLNTVYKVLIWEDPKISFITLGVLHIVLWLVVQLELRFYGIIFMLCLIVFLCDLYFEKKDLKAERCPSSEAMLNIGSAFTNCISYLQELRKENHSLFCVLLCGLFLMLAIIAHNVPGFILLYLLLLTIFTCPLAISKIPPEYLSKFNQIVNTIRTNEGLLAESELLPFIANKDLVQKDADLESLLTDKTADSVSNSFISGMASMPSYLDVERDSLNCLEEEDLEFAMRNNHSPAVVFTPGGSTSDSDSDHKSMNFESSHFNGDSSSEDENGYTKGLQFTETDATTSDAGILSNLTNIGSNLISNVLKTAVLTNIPKRNDSDSDFEIIDNEEVAES